MRCVPHLSPTIGFFHVEKHNIDINPEYQREASVWGIDKRQLFIDSLLNGYDVPKIYMHLLPDGKGAKYALVDGKQRLSAIWDFLDCKFVLGNEFKLSSADSHLGKPAPKAGIRFKDFSPGWQEKFRSFMLPVIVIEDADDGDIEDIFSRLNDGEPLNAAEKRNARGGDMCRVIRDVAKHKFFKSRVSFRNRRYIFLDIAARFLLIEDGVVQGASPYRDLKKRFLDALVADNGTIPAVRKKKLLEQVTKQMNDLSRVFDAKDPLLRKQGDPQLYYLFVKEMTKNYAGPKLFSQIKKFIPEFQAQRTQVRELSPDKKAGLTHGLLDDFERLDPAGQRPKQFENARLHDVQTLS